MKGLTNHLTIWRANIAHQKEAMYALFKELTILINMACTVLL